MTGSMGYGNVSELLAALRARIPKRETDGLLAPAVLGYIYRKHLYGTNLDLKRLTLEDLRPIALSYLKAKRIPHVLGTEQTAKALAEKYGADIEKARFAALLHDATKRLSMEPRRCFSGCVPLPRARAFCLSFCFPFPLAFLRQMNSMFSVLV